MEETQVLENFNLELKWCVQQIEISMKKEKNSRKANEFQKSFKILTSQKQPIIKKRQVMRMLFGDYREKILKEKDQFKPNSPKVQKGTIPGSSKFIKKSLADSLSLAPLKIDDSCTNYFKFNFPITENNL